jgi:hypothetical protein
MEQVHEDTSTGAPVAQPAVTAGSAAMAAEPIRSALMLQRTAGNRATTSLLRPPAVSAASEELGAAVRARTGISAWPEGEAGRTLARATRERRTALAHATLSRPMIQRREVCDAQGVCRSEPDEPANAPRVCTPVPGAVSSTKLSKAVPVSSFVTPDATYALAVTTGFRTATGYSVPEGLLAEQALATEAVTTAESLVVTESLAVGGSTVVEGATLAESLAAAGETLLVLEAGGAAEVEAATGPPGWIVGAVVLVAAGGLLLTAYLLSDKPAKAGHKPDPGPKKQDPEGLVCGPAPVTGTGPAPQTQAPKYPNQICTNERLTELHDAMKKLCDAGISCSDAAEREEMGETTRKGFQKRIDAGQGWPCPEILSRLRATEACLKAREQIQKECFGNVPEPGHDRQIESARQALETCRAKAKARGC